MSWLPKPRGRPEGVLAGAGELPDTGGGRRKYLEYLEWMNHEAEAQRKAGLVMDSGGLTGYGIGIILPP